MELLLINFLQNFFSDYNYYLINIIYLFQRKNVLNNFI